MDHEGCHAPAFRQCQVTGVEVSEMARVTAEGVFVDRILYKKRDYLPLLGLQ